MRRRNLCIALVCMVMGLGAAGCGKNPDSSIVKNKDFDKLIEEAQKEEGKDKSVKDIAPKGDTYKKSFQDDNLGVSVDVDAVVDVPAADKMSILRIKQKDISQKFIDTFIENYAKDVKLYDGSVTSVRIKSDVEKEMGEIKEAMKTCSEEEKSEYEIELETLQEEYELSPAELKWEDYVSDKNLYKVEDICKKRNNAVYEWMKDLNPKGDVFYAVNDGKDKEYISIYAQNSDSYGNCFRYRKNKHGYEFTASQAVTNTALQNIDYGNDSNTVWKAGGDIPKYAWEEEDISEYTDEKASLSEEEAKKQAKELMDKLGLNEFDFYDCGLYCEVPDIRDADDEEFGYRTMYIIRYKRKVDDIFVTSYGEKYSEGEENGEYTKKIWSQECVEIRINDNGMIGFDYNSPIEIVETVVDQSNMKNFDEVKKTFEKMSVITNANDNTDGVELCTNIKVEQVILGYVMISEKDNFDTGLLVPGWEFVGLTTPGYKEDNQFVPVKEMQNYGSILTVNAIDGTVIDKTLGY